MALEISRSQGKAITGQTIFEVASQIKQNPNGVLTQAIIQLAKQDTHDNGKTGQTVNIIKKTVQVTEKREKDGGGTNKKGQGVQPAPGIQPAPGYQTSARSTTSASCKHTRSSSSTGFDTWYSSCCSTHS